MSATLNHTEVSRRFADQHSPNVRHVSDLDEWRVKDANGLWIRDEGNAHAQEDAKATLDGIAEEAGDALSRGNVERHKTLSRLTMQASASLPRILRDAASDPQIRTLSGDYDRTPHLLKTPNAVIDLRTGMPVEVGPGELFTRQTNALWDPSTPADYGRWGEFMAFLVPDPEMRAFLQRLLGCSAFGHNAEKGAVCLQGDSDHGKSQFVGCIRGVMGTYATELGNTILLQRVDATDRFGRTALLGTRFATASEFESGQRINASLFKTLTDPMSTTIGRGAGKEEERAPTSATIWMDTNHYPDFVGDKACYNRLFPITFDRHMSEFPFEAPGQGKDRLVRYLAEHHNSTILRYIVDGAKAWTNEGLVIPAKVLAIRESLCNDQQPPMQKFFATCTERLDGGQLDASLLYQAFRQWWSENAQPAQVPTQQAFGRELTSLGFPSKTGKLARLDGSRRDVTWRLGVGYSEEGTHYASKVAAVFEEYEGSVR